MITGLRANPSSDRAARFPLVKPLLEGKSVQIPDVQADPRFPTGFGSVNRLRARC